MDMLTRFINYCKVNTRSSESSCTSPSTSIQYDFAKDVLVPDLLSLGIEDVTLSKQGIVYGRIKGNDTSKPKIGLVAHMDTADYESGHVNPQLITNYDGSDITLKNDVTLSIAQFPWLENAIGKTIITTDGTTLLGADDKAGIAIIFSVLEYVLTHPSLQYNDIAFAFTPDEEVGRGTENFDVSIFDVDFAYTIDGGNITSIATDTFNAAKAVIEIHGKSIHPGSAKGQMINACDIAVELAAALPAEQKAQYTSGDEGFYHLDHMEANCEHATLNYIIRDHDYNKLKDKKEYLKQLVKAFNLRYANAIELIIKDQYRNMQVVLKDHPEVLQAITDAYDSYGLPYHFEKVRGGTDGANLSFMGVPCPNLGTGGYNCHGPYEYAVLEEMETMVKVIVTMLTGEVL